MSAAVATAERTRRLPQQSTLDGGLRGAPPPLRRLSAVEPRHLAPLSSPPHSPRQIRVGAPPAPAPAPVHAAPPPHHPTPTISVSSAPDDESAGSPSRTASPEDRRSVAHSDEPSSVFASADVTPTEPATAFGERYAMIVDHFDATSEVLKVEKQSSIETPHPSAEVVLRVEAKETPKESKDEPHVIVKEGQTRSTEGECSSVRLSSRESSITRDVSVTPTKSIEDKKKEETSRSESEGAVAPLAVCEDIVDDEVDKVPSIPARVSEDSKASESNAIKKVAHRDELSSVSESDIVKRNKSAVSERKQRNDICPWEDE